MISTLHSAVRHCGSRKLSHTHGREQRELSLFLPVSSLDYIGMHTLGPLPIGKEDEMFCDDELTPWPSLLAQ